jgi:hypothetical protein
MARAYSVRITALTLGVPPKWVDNVLSHHTIPGVVSQRQGVERTVSDPGIRTLELVRLLVQELDVPIASAVQIATSIVASHESAFRTPSGMELRVDIDAIDRRMRDRLMDAVEATPRPRRGRPKKLG